MNAQRGSHLASGGIIDHFAPRVNQLPACPSLMNRVSRRPPVPTRRGQLVACLATPRYSDDLVTLGQKVQNGIFCTDRASRSVAAVDSCAAFHSGPRWRVEAVVNGHSVTWDETADGLAGFLRAGDPSGPSVTEAGQYP